MDQNITVFFEAMTTIQWPIPVTTFSVITWHVQPLFQSNEVLSPWWWLLSTAAITWWSEAPLPMSLLTCAVAPCHHSHKPGTKMLKCWNTNFDILRYKTSSLTVTSSPSTQTFSILTHWPTVQLQRKSFQMYLWCHKVFKLSSENLQPIIQESIQECCLIRAPFSMVLRLMHTPSSITTPGPMVTLGPGMKSKVNRWR